MEEKFIVVQTTRDEFVKIYLSLFYGNMKLTGTEQKVLEFIVGRYIELKDKVQEPYLTELVLSSDRRKSISSGLGISRSHLNNNIKSLKEKGVFLNTDKIEIDPRLVPSEKITFSFEIVDSLNIKVSSNSKENKKKKKVQLKQ